jgi:copper chaperone CopZ
MKYLIMLMLLFPMLSSHTWAQNIQISISGLTCSQCSRSVEMQLKKVKSVSSIEMDLKNTEAKVALKKGVNIDYKEIAQAVYNAGFSIDQFIVNFPKSYILSNTNSCIKTKDGELLIVNDENNINFDKSLFTVKFLGKPFSIDKINKNKKWCSGSTIYYINML